MPQAETRFEEFQAFHIMKADGIHNLVGGISRMSPCRSCRLTSRKGPISAVAQALHPELRESSAQRVWLQWILPVSDFLKNLNRI